MGLVPESRLEKYEIATSKLLADLAEREQFIGQLADAYADLLNVLSRDAASDPLLARARHLQNTLKST